MKHRIGARGILVNPADETILLALEYVTPDGNELWVTPGGGLEPEDGSLADGLRREFREETGLTVQIGPLLYVREYIETSRQTHHIGLYFLVHSPEGKQHETDQSTPPLGEDLRRHTRWFTREDLQDIFVRPEDLREGAWLSYAVGVPEARYLGVGHEESQDETARL